MYWKFSQETIFFLIERHSFVKFGLFLIRNFSFIWRVSFSLHLRERKLDFFEFQHLRQKKWKIACVFNHYNWNYCSTLLACILSANPEGWNVHIYTKNGWNKRPEKKMKKVYPLITWISKAFLAQLQQNAMQKFCMFLHTRNQIPCYHNKIMTEENEYKCSSLTKGI